MKAVKIAVKARDEVNPDALVFGCVSPLGCCYNILDVPDYETCLKEHKENMKYMIDAGVDFILIETACTQVDALAAVKAAEELIPGNWGISFSLPLETIGVLRDGSEISDFVHKLKGAAFIGFNCMDGKQVLPQIKHLRKIVPKNIRISAYGNIGYWEPPKNYKAGVKRDNTVDNEATYAACVKQWLDAGATIVGGCCGTSPATIRMLHASVKINQL